MKRRSSTQRGSVWGSRVRWLAAASVLVFVAGTVSAQGGGSGGRANAEVKFRKSSQLSPQEQLTQTGVYQGRMQNILTKVSKLAERARKEKDIIKLNCVNDKLIQIKGNMRVGDQAKSALQGAANRGNTSECNHQFSKLTIIFQKVTVLGQEAEACIGDELAYVGKTKVEVQIDPDIPQDDPTQTGEPPLPNIRPPVASPFN